MYEEDPDSEAALPQLVDANYVGMATTLRDLLRRFSDWKVLGISWTLKLHSKSTSADAFVTTRSIPFNMETAIQVLKALGLTSSLLLAGANISSSYLTIPILYTRPASVSTPIFREFYYRGAFSLVPIGIFSATCSALVAFLDPVQRQSWMIAAAVTISQTPFTLIFMMGTNDRLNEIAEMSEGVRAEKVQGDEVVRLLRKWAWMNFGRGLLALAGGLAGLAAVMKK
ncbi:hypothetical protein MMC25_002661 [Agyrium rufum]|nr:hypothetical protein [Agyrium rufum]